jgi:hypothetical protein
MSASIKDDLIIQGALFNEKEVGRNKIIPKNTIELNIIEGNEYNKLKQKQYIT